MYVDKSGGINATLNSSYLWAVNGWRESRLSDF